MGFAEKLREVDEKKGDNFFGWFVVIRFTAPWGPSGGRMKNGRFN